MYRVAYRTSFAKDLKAFKKNKPLKEQVKKAVLEVIENPDIGIPYKANMQGLIKYSFYERPQMRIIFAQYDCCTGYDEKSIECRFEGVEELEEGESCNGLIDFVFVKTREQCNNLYRKNRAYFENYLRTLEDDETSE